MKGMCRPSGLSALTTRRLPFGRLGYLGATTLLAGLQFSPAGAQTPAAQETHGAAGAVSQTPPVQAGRNQLEQIVVTAQRRSEKLEKTPVTVTALTSTALRKRAITTESDLQTATSGLLVRQGTSSNQLNFAVRGQSIDVFSNSQPGVLPYFDEVQDDTHSASAFYDLQSIQVLKGPQGTLFGRNDTGGAVLITSVKPSNDLGGFLTTRVGDYGYTETLGALNVPIVPDKILLRVSGDYDHRDGYVHDVYSNTTPGTVLHEAGRISLEVKPTDWLQNTTVIDYIHSGGTNTPSEIYNAYAPGSTNNGVPLNATAAEFYSPFLDKLLHFPGAYAFYLSQNPKADPLGIEDSVKQQALHGPNWVDAPGTYLHRSDNTIVSNITTIDLGDGVTLKNIFGFDRANSVDYTDAGGAPYALELSRYEGLNNDSTDFSEEVQLLGKTLGNQLTYVTGFYYLTSHNYGGVGLSILGLPPIIPATNALYFYNLPSTSYAGYAQGTYDLSRLTGVQGLGFTAGLRYTGEDYSEQQLPGSVVYGLPGLSNQLSQSETKLSWQFGAQEQLNPNLLLYVVSRHSFRSGGFNPTVPPVPGTASTGGAAFYPETTTDVEVGAKYEGHLDSIPVRLNADAFNQWVSNAQRIDYVLNPTTMSIAGLTVNVPQAEITGFEADGEIRPQEWLDLGLSVTYTDARYTNGLTEVFGQPTQFGPYADTPKWSGSAFVELSEDLPRDYGHASFRTDVFAQSKFYFSNLNNSISPGTAIPGYGLVNFRLALENIKQSNFTLAGYVRNAFNHPYYAGGIASGPALGFNSVQPGLPRMFFVEGTYNF